MSTATFPAVPDPGGPQPQDPSWAVAGARALLPRGIGRDRFPEGRLYREGVGSERLDPAAHGLPGDYHLAPGTPSWSPDGRRLAWVAQRDAAGGVLGAVVVFDLAEVTARVLYTHEASCLDCVVPAAVWSADGEWLAYNSLAADAGEAGTWILRADGGEAGRIDGYDAIWSPNGRQIVVTRIEQNGESRLWLVDVSTGEAVELALPAYTQAVAWRAVGD